MTGNPFQACKVNCFHHNLYLQDDPIRASMSFASPTWRCCTFFTPVFKSAAMFVGYPILRCQQDAATEQTCNLQPFKFDLITCLSSVFWLVASYLRTTISPRHASWSTPRDIGDIRNIKLLAKLSQPLLSALCSTFIVTTLSWRYMKDIWRSCTTYIKLSISSEPICRRISFSVRPLSASMRASQVGKSIDREDSEKMHAICCNLLQRKGQAI